MSQDGRCSACRLMFAAVWPMTETTRYVDVAVAGPLRRSFVYRVPPAITSLHPGQRVVVPFGSTRKMGFYLGPSHPRPGVQIKELIELIDEESYFPGELFEFCRWLATYYFANPADCLGAALPPLLKSASRPVYTWGNAPLRESPPWMHPVVKPHRRVPPDVLRRIRGEGKGLLRLLQNRGVILTSWPGGERRRRRVAGYRIAAAETLQAFFHGRGFQPHLFDGVRSRADLMSYGWTAHYLRLAVAGGVLKPVYRHQLDEIQRYAPAREEVCRLQPNDEQQAVIAHVCEALDGGFAAMLLHGVTGSGKTLVYCHVCRDVMARGRTALVLTPEITLAGTTLAYFRGFFGDQVTVVHSAMTDRERLDSFNGVREGRFRIVVGPRSAIFAQLESLGLVIVDEEHDGSYKQDDPSPRFHGRDAAVMRAKINNVPVLLGSATPSLESYYHATTGRYRLLQLRERPGGAGLPQVQIVQMQRERVRGDLPFLSWSLKKEVQKRFDRDEQIILYLNRRGHSPILKCTRCGHVPRCPHCRVNLTYHTAGRKLACHYCGHIEITSDTCRSCGGADFLYLGAGTQKVEEAIPRLFQGARSVRFDSDAVAGRGRAHQVLSDFAQGKYNLLLGTQMVTKGLDLPGVTLVGVLAADMSLDMPDFRAAEKTLAQLMQVAGRSGRSDKAGTVFIQTYYPNSEVIQMAAAQDYRAFYDQEIRSRQELSYPPFVRLVNCILSARDEEKLQSAIHLFRDNLLERISSSEVAVTLIGPAPCPLYYLRGRYRRHLVAKTSQILRFVRLLTDWEAQETRFKLPASVRIIVDVDPDDMM